MEQQITKDIIAQRVYGDSYNRLSAWGQDAVDKIFYGNPKVDETGVIQELNNEVMNMTLEERIAFQDRRIANLEIDNEELWLENSQLKQDLATLQSEINQEST